MRWTLLLAPLPTLALAQSSTPRPEDLGTVTGHIIAVAVTSKSPDPASDEDPAT